MNTRFEYIQRHGYPYHYILDERLPPRVGDYTLVTIIAAVMNNIASVVMQYMQ